MLGIRTPDTLDVARVTQVRNATVQSSAPAFGVSAGIISARGTATLAEALKTIPGVSIRDYGGIGGLKTVNIRNFGSQHTGICYDGLTISDAQNGQTDISRFNLEGLQSIGIEIAGSDDIFRSARLAASAGVLTLTSARPVFDSVGTRASARLRYGSFNTWNPCLSIEQRLSEPARSGSGSSWAMAVWADYLNSRGNYPFLLQNGTQAQMRQRLNSDVSSLNSEANIYGDMGRHGRLRIKLSCSAGDRGLPGSVVYYTENPVERLRDRDIHAGVTYENEAGNRLKFKASASYRNNWSRHSDSNPIYPEPTDDRYLQQEGAVSGVILWNIIEGLSVSAAQDLVVSTLSTSLPTCPFPTREASYTALSARYSTDRLSATATLLGTIMLEQASKGTAAPGRQRLSPSASISYRISRSTPLRIRAAYKESYRMPTFNDLYYPRVGNSSLEPETARQTNLGLTWTGSFGGHTIDLSADAYYNNVRNKIVAVPSMFIWSMRNVGKVDMTGCDLSAAYSGSVCNWLKIKAMAGYSYQYAVDVSDPGAKNYRHQIPYTPRHCGSGSLIADSRWITLSYSLQAVGERYSLAQNTAAYRIAPYADHSVSASHSFAFGTRHRWTADVSAQALNLAGVNYEIIKYYPMPGRQFRITIKITY